MKEIDKEKETSIIVNSRVCEWGEKKISFAQVIELALGTYTDDDTKTYSVTYAKGEAPKHEGSMVKGSIVKVKKGMVFNVTQTDKS